MLLVRLKIGGGSWVNFGHRRHRGSQRMATRFTPTTASIWQMATMIQLIQEATPRCSATLRVSAKALGLAFEILVLKLVLKLVKRTKLGQFFWLDYMYESEQSERDCWR